MLRDPDEIRERMKRIKVFILDMDGTIYLGDDLFPYTHKFLDKVTATGRKYYFFTNNSSKDIHTYFEKLHRMGIDIAKEQMMVSTDVIIRWLQKNYAGKKLYVVGTPALCRAFTENGWVLDDQHPDIVILGFDTTLTYEKLSRACTFIRHGALYFGINPDLNCPVENNEFIPDCGSMARLIESSTGRYPEFFGKPSKKTLEYIVEATGMNEDEIAMVGDRLYTDIAVADGSAVTSILVMSGETQESDLKKSKTVPDIAVENIGKLADLL
jgi:glycerol-1-phosphate dehydrogenase [NAD(P)+]